MTDVQQAITEQLAIAKGLIDGRHLDLERTLTMLKALPDDIGESVRSRVEEALQAVAAAVGQDSRYEAVARFALARVIVMLENDSPEPGTAKRPRLLSGASSRLKDHTFSPRMY